MSRKPHPETCERCPHRYSKAGCPCWITEKNGFLETNIQTGEERIVTGCFYEVMPKLMMHVVQAANRPAAAVESTRNEIAQGFQEIGKHMRHLPALLDQTRREQ
jgi:hypothetical protein